MLVHSADFSSSSFLALKNNSLGLLLLFFVIALHSTILFSAFVLANNGYDVFLLNLRGSRYSRKHTTLSITESAFWDYTLDHLAQYDLSTAFKFIEKLTGHRKVLYVGHNSGASIFLAQGAQFPNEIKDRVIAAALIAPIVEMKHSSRYNLATELLSAISNIHWVI